MKCLLIDPPDELFPSAEGAGAESATEMHEVYPSLGLLYIAASLRRDGVECGIVEARTQRLSEDEVLSAVEGERPEFVGITAITARIHSALRIAAGVKRLEPKTIVILGGPHVNFEHRAVIENDAVDFCVRGEGERTIVELLRALSDGANLADVAGITFKRDGQVVATSDRPFVPDLDALPFPARDLLQHPAYAGAWTDGMPFTPVLGSRGCPYHCAFCDAPAIWGRRHRRRSVDNVLDELEQIRGAFGVKYVRFVDDLLLANRPWAMELCEGMGRRGLHDVAWACDGRVGLMSEELLAAMKQANCRVIFCGVEFGNQRILDLCNKGFTLAQVRDTIEMSARVGISSYGYFMMGYPSETVKTVEDTINFAKELALNHGMDSAGFSIVTPFPGTPLYDHCKQHNMLRTPDWRRYSYQLKQGVIELEHITDAELHELYERAVVEFQFKEQLRQFA